MDRPRWLDDEAEIRQLLHRLVDMLDKQPLAQRKQALRIKVDKNTLPALFRHDAQSDHEWAMLQTLAGQYHLFEIRHARQRGQFDAEFANAGLIFIPQAEPVLRRWLQRPPQLPYPRQWRNAVTKYAAGFSDRGEALLNRPAHIVGKTAEQIVAGFAQLAQLIDKGLSLRQLSARCFWGQSKFLDAREELVTALFPNADIRPRPIMVNVCLPKEIRGVLFIENHDTYINAIPTNSEVAPPFDFRHLALVYLSGFQGGAKRIRDQAGVSLHFHSRSETAEKPAFENWWFEHGPQSQPCFFWGDLDFSGMAILKTLRRRFTLTEAWQPGYELMLEQINTGRGHEARPAGKEEQVDPGLTGCHYADNVLLPALRRTALSVDQEWI